MYHLKLWLDTVHQRVEIKGDSVWLNAKRIIITSNHTLESALTKVDYQGHTSLQQEDYEAVKARIHHIWRATNKFFDYKKAEETF